MLNECHEGVTKVRRAENKAKRLSLVDWQGPTEYSSYVADYL